MKKNLLTVFAIVFALVFFKQIAFANTIIDTGSSWVFKFSFNTDQYFASEFHLSESYSINTIEGLFASDHSLAFTGGTVAINLHSSDGTSIPGTVLNSADFNLPSNQPTNWYGRNDLDWILSPGSYWISFAPDNNIDASILGGSAAYAEFGSGFVSRYNGVWKENPSSYYNINTRIYGETAPVPEPATMLLLGTGLVGVAGAARRRKKNQA